MGFDRGKIVQAVTQLLESPKEYSLMASAKNPFGDGTAGVRIVNALLSRQSEGGTQSHEMEGFS